VLNAVAEKAGWGKPAPAGVFRGLAQHMGYGSYVAACAEVSVERCGQAEDPPHRRGHRLRARGESAADRGADRGLVRLRPVGALYGEITIKDGKVEQENFDTYPCMRMDEMPKVESIVMPSGDFWGGVGEPTIFVAAPAVLNAIFAATGKRIRDLPLHKHDLRKA
jgi:isoquinoline 1-oxidoreductase subunit beta